MRKIYYLAFIYLLINQVGIATGSPAPFPAGVRIEVFYSSENGCSVTLPRSDNDANFVNKNSRVYALPKAQQQLIRFLRRSGWSRYGASVNAEITIPKACSGSIVKALKLADFEYIAFHFPIRDDDGRPIERKSVCEVSADPIRFGGDRIELRGFVSTFSNAHETKVYLREEALCGQVGIRLIDGDAALGLNDDFTHPVEMIVTGTTGSSPCLNNPPPGLECGAYFLVENSRIINQLDR